MGYNLPTSIADIKTLLNLTKHLNKHESKWLPQIQEDNTLPQFQIDSYLELSPNIYEHVLTVKLVNVSKYISLKTY